MNRIQRSSSHYGKDFWQPGAVLNEGYARNVSDDQAMHGVFLPEPTSLNARSRPNMYPFKPSDGTFLLHILSSSLLNRKSYHPSTNFWLRIVPKKSRFIPKACSSRSTQSSPTASFFQVPTPGHCPLCTRTYRHASSGSWCKPCERNKETKEMVSITTASVERQGQRAREAALQF